MRLLNINVALARADALGRRAALKLANRAHSRAFRMGDADSDDLWSEFESSLAQSIDHAYVAGRRAYHRSRGVMMAHEDVRREINRLPKRQKDAINELYGKIAASATSSTRARVRDKMVAGVKQFVTGDHNGYTKKLTSIRLGTAAALDTIVRTQNAIAFNAAIWHESDADDELWGWELSTAGDERVRHSHEVMDGVRYPKNHQFWKYYFPPNGWRCRCTANPVYADEPEAGVIVPYQHGTPDVPKEFKFNPGKMLAGILSA